MARGSSIQKPTTLLTIKKSMEGATTSGNIRGDIIVITDNGQITGELRVATGNPVQTAPPWTDKTIPLYPVGAIIYFAGPNPPDGFLVCNGQEYETEDYPELANYLKGLPAESSRYSLGDVADPYYQVKPYVSTSGIYTGKEVFRTPDYTNFAGLGGGLFIRNLNYGGFGGNSTLPDWQVDYRNETDGKNDPAAVSTLINRTFGSVQDEMYLWHKHRFANTFSGFTGEDHVHHYFGAPGANNGHMLGYTYKSPSSTNSLIMSMYDKVDTDIRTESSTKLHDNFDMVGTHIHAGFLGYGASYLDTEHLTIHNVDSNFDNSTETKPVNYSVLFCIKY